MRNFDYLDMFDMFDSLGGFDMAQFNIWHLGIFNKFIYVLLNYRQKLINDIIILNKQDLLQAGLLLYAPFFYFKKKGFWKRT